MLDLTITLGNIIEVGVIVGGGLLVLVRLNNSVIDLRAEVKTMQNEIKKLGEVVTMLAVTTTRLDRVEKDIRDLQQAIRSN